MNYGYIGLGNLGAHLAMSLVKAGFSVTVNDLDKENARELLAAGAKWGQRRRRRSASAVTRCSPACPRRRRRKRC